MEAAEMSINPWMNNQKYHTHARTTHTYTVVLFSCGMKVLGKWVELETIALNEVTQAQKDKHGTYLLKSGYWP